MHLRRAAAMQVRAEQFQGLVSAVLARYCTQNARPVPSSAEIVDFVARLWALIEEPGLPPPLAPNETGAPGEMPESEFALLVGRVLGETADSGLADPIRQVVKACFYPEFKNCRDSFREVSPDGSCRRQELARARKRASGSHCVDCPYWVALSPEQHERFLTRYWRAGAADFAAGRGVFLPEDFRALRRWIRKLARESHASSS